MKGPGPIPLDRCRELARLGSERFEASPELEAWARSAFIDEGSELWNGDHAHLENASLGFLLTNVESKQRGHTLLGTCGMGEPTGKPWPRSQREQQILEWFGEVPTFIITLNANFLASAEPLAICALVEHEMYHAGQKIDRWGSPVYDKDGAPVFDTKPHDVEEFTGVVRRYGAWEPALEEFARALSAPPLFGPVRIDGICGCGRAIA